MVGGWADAAGQPSGTVMRHISERSEKEGWCFSKKACCAHVCTRAIFQAFHQLVQIGSAYYLSIFLPLSTFPLLFLAPLYFSFLSAFSSLPFHFLSRHLQYSSLPFCFNPSSFPICVAFPTSPSVHIRVPCQSCLAQTGTKGKETSSGDALLSDTVIRQRETAQMSKEKTFVFVCLQYLQYLQ